MSAVDLAYPIGRFQKPPHGESASRHVFLSQIAESPEFLRRAVLGLDDSQLDTPYREGGWTVRQVVHHLADSQSNAYVRFKLALTETEPLIKPYNEALWAEVPEAKSGPVALSLELFEAVTRRWMACASVLAPASFERAFRHPEVGIMTLDQQLALYAWHGRHHVAHITSLAARAGWA